MESQGAYSFPDGHSDCAKCQSEQCKKGCTKSVPYSAAYDPNACGYSCVVDGQWKEGVYTRVHRDTQIINAMRSWMGVGEVEDFGLLGLHEKCYNKQNTFLYLE